MFPFKTGKFIHFKATIRKILNKYHTTILYRCHCSPLLFLGQWLVPSEPAPGPACSHTSHTSGTPELALTISAKPSLYHLKFSRCR